MLTGGEIQLQNDILGKEAAKDMWEEKG